MSDTQLTNTPSEEELDQILSNLGASNIPDTDGKYQEVDPVSIAYVREALLAWREAYGQERYEVGRKAGIAENQLEVVNRIRKSHGDLPLTLDEISVSVSSADSKEVTP